MSAKRKTPAKVQQAKGTVKENTGRAVGNESMTAEGRTERVAADLREAGRKIRNAFKR